MKNTVPNPWRGIRSQESVNLKSILQLQVEDGVLQGGEKYTYVEVPQELSIEIDSALDLAFAEQILIHEGLEPFATKLETSFKA